MGIDRENCESCQALVEKYGEENLEICEHCGHYFYDNCTCFSAEEEREDMNEEYIDDC